MRVIDLTKCEEFVAGKSEREVLKIALMPYFSSEMLITIQTKISIQPLKNGAKFFGLRGDWFASNLISDTEVDNDPIDILNTAFGHSNDVRILVLRIDFFESLKYTDGDLCFKLLQGKTFSNAVLQEFKVRRK